MKVVKFGGSSMADAPKFSVDGNVTDFYAFTKDSFRLEGYRYHPFDFEIPMAI